MEHAPSNLATTTSCLAPEAIPTPTRTPGKLCTQLPHDSRIQTGTKMFRAGLYFLLIHPHSLCSAEEVLTQKTLSSYYQLSHQDPALASGSTKMALFSLSGSLTYNDTVTACAGFPTSVPVSLSETLNCWRGCCCSSLWCVCVSTCMHACVRACVCVCMCSYDRRNVAHLSEFTEITHKELRIQKP